MCLGLARRLANAMSDVNNFSRYYRQRAEVLLDAINDILDTEDKFDAVPMGARSTQLWTHRSSLMFLDTFGRPDPNQDPPCERTTDSTTPQILHLMNSPELNRKLHDDAALTARIGFVQVPRWAGSTRIRLASHEVTVQPIGRSGV